ESVSESDGRLTLGGGPGPAAGAPTCGDHRARRRDENTFSGRGGSPHRRGCHRPHGRRRARERPAGAGVSRPGVIPGPTVTVRTEENIAPPRGPDRQVVAGWVTWHKPWAVCVEPVKGAHDEPSRLLPRCAAADRRRADPVAR